MTRCKLVPATQALVEEFYGKVPMFSMRGFIVMFEEKPIGIVGIYTFQEKIIAFSQMKDEMRPLKKEIVRVIKSFMQFLSEMNVPVYAIASQQEPTSLELLPKLGFAYLGEFSGDKVFILEMNHG